jgi:hypothetical protein
MAESNKPKRGQVLARLEKPRSPLAVEFQVDKEDEDLVRVRYMTKKGEEKRHSTIILKDVEQWVSSLERDGYNKV